MEEDPLSNAIIGAAIEVHREFGPGLLEGIYESALAKEFDLRQIPYERQKPIVVEYKGSALDVGFRIDFLVADLVIVELKSVDQLAPIHDAQVLTYFKLTSKRLGLLLNFNVPRLRQGIKRLVLNL